MYFSGEGSSIDCDWDVMDMVAAKEVAKQKRWARWEHLNQYWQVLKISEMHNNHILHCIKFFWKQTEVFKNEAARRGLEIND